MAALIDETGTMWLGTSYDVLKSVDTAGDTKKIDIHDHIVYALGSDGIIRTFIPTPDKKGHYMVPELKELYDAVDFVIGERFLCCLFKDGSIGYWTYNVVFNNQRKVTRNQYTSKDVRVTETIKSIQKYDQLNNLVLLYTWEGSIITIDSKTLKTNYLYDANEYGPASQCASFAMTRPNFNSHNYALLTTDYKIYFQGDVRVLQKITDIQEGAPIVDDEDSTIETWKDLENIVSIASFPGFSQEQRNILMAIDANGEVYFSGSVPENLLFGVRTEELDALSPFYKVSLLNQENLGNIIRITSTLPLLLNDDGEVFLAKFMDSTELNLGPFEKIENLPPILSLPGEMISLEDISQNYSKSARKY